MNVDTKATLVGSGCVLRVHWPDVDGHGLPVALWHTGPDLAAIPGAKAVAMLRLREVVSRIFEYNLTFCSKFLPISKSLFYA